MKASRGRWKTRLRNDWQIYVLLLPGVIYFIVFHYIPLYGIQIAFRDYKAALGIMESPWGGLVEFYHFLSLILLLRTINHQYVAAECI